MIILVGGFSVGATLPSVSTQLFVSSPGKRVTMQLRPRSLQHRVDAPPLFTTTCHRASCTAAEAASARVRVKAPVVPFLPSGLSGDADPLLRTPARCRTRHHPPRSACPARCAVIVTSSLLALTGPTPLTRSRLRLRRTGTVVCGVRSRRRVSSPLTSGARARRVPARCPLALPVRQHYQRSRLRLRRTGTVVCSGRGTAARE